MIGCCAVQEKDAASLDLNRGRAPGMLIGSNFGGRGPYGTIRRTHTTEMGPKGLLICWSLFYILITSRI
jgi:hypothetical protein